MPVSTLFTTIDDYKDYHFIQSNPVQMVSQDNKSIVSDESAKITPGHLVVCSAKVRLKSKWIVIKSSLEDLTIAPHPVPVENDVIAFEVASYVKKV